MRTERLQITLTALLGMIACVAVTAWLFRLGPLWGILGLNVTKHLLIAGLCREVGLDRRQSDRAPLVTRIDDAA